MEYIDIYTKLGEKTGKSMEKTMAHEQGLYHRAVHVWILNKKGELLIQRRSKNKRTFPGMLDISFAGHISKGENSLEAVVREGKEELGIDIDFEKLEYIFSFRKEFIIEENKYYENEIADVYIYEKEIEIDEFEFLDKEVEDVRYIDFRKLEKMWKEKDKELINQGIEYSGLFYTLHKKFDKI